MTRTRSLVLVAALGAITATLAELADPHGSTAALAVLGAAVVAGELFVLRPAQRAALPLSYAVVLVLLRAGTPAEFIVTVIAAELLALLFRQEPAQWDRIWVTATRIGAALAALLVFRGVEDLLRPGDHRWIVLVSLAAAGAAEILVDDLLAMVRTRRYYFSMHGRSADLALVTSGMLMSIGYEGIGGHQGMGLWGPLLFSIPLLAAWYSFERLASIRKTYDQTILALSVVPELAGLARAGHAERVAELSLELGREMGLDNNELEYLRAAALLHHLGHLCLDAPEASGHEIEPSEVTDKGAEILRQTEYLRPAGDMLASDTPSLASQILRVASAYDELTAGDPVFAEAAVEALYSGPGYVYDARVLDALDRVVIGAPPALVG